MRFINLIIIALLLSACGSMANIDYDKSADFKLLKTYKINPEPVRISADTRINSPFMQQRVVNELEIELSKKGFVRINENAELEIKYYLDSRAGLVTQDSGLSIGVGSFSRHSAVGFGFNVPSGETSSIDKLILTIDIYSTKTEKLIWRGSLSDLLARGATPEVYTRLVKDLVIEILKEFPPR